MNVFIRALLLAFCLFPAEYPAWGEEESDSRTENAVVILKAVPKPERNHFSDIKEADNVLCEIFNDAKNNEELRRRALYAAGLFPTKKVYAVMLELLSSAEPSVVLKTEAMISLARGFGEKSLTELKKFLNSGDKGLRIGAIVAISNIASKKAAEILSAHLGSEPDIDVKSAIESAIKRIEET
ncbi:MAG: HEAT repeat domain-containing protein, partial [Deltaproteobacteria bacterium]|nr:HEAT repeat domain-containing protein [Deltaproteobacteria bacterium]